MNKTSDKLSVRLLIDSFLFHGVTHVVVSPGSRNAPLIVGLSESKKFQLISIVDERSAAFYALGMAQQLQISVPIICTSGSALLNYAPAVAEAYYQRVPMLIVSADRPTEWIDQGDGQTIRQTGVYSNFIDYQIALPFEISTETQSWHYKREIETALNLSKKGPVHINLPFNEPLYNKIGQQVDKQRNYQLATPQNQIAYDDLRMMKEVWNSYTKKLILIGQMPSNPRLLKALEFFMNDPETAVVVENLSNVVDQKIIHCIDRTLAGMEGNETDFAPEILITIGGAIVSKKIKAFLRKYQPTHHWRVGTAFPYMDTYQSLSLSLPINAEEFLEQFSVQIELRAASNFSGKWSQTDKLMEVKHHEFVGEVAYSDFKVSEILLDCVPENSQIHLGNSSIVRYAQLFNPIKSINYLCNRGTSGIDGSLSTAMGAAFVNSNRLHTLLLGDLSFLYDSNGLWNQLSVPNLRIFVINNGGGGIFKIIPGPDTTAQLDDFFTTKHDFSAEHICRAFDVAYFKADSTETILNQMETFYSESENNRPMLMEIFTPYEENDKVLKAYFKFLASS